MEILLWLLPPLVVTFVAMAWAGWVGRAGRGHVDQDEALRRMGAVLEHEPTVTHRVEPAPRERSTGVAVRRPTDEPVEETDEATDERTDEPAAPERRAS